MLNTSLDHNNIERFDIANKILKNTSYEYLQVFIQNYIHTIQSGNIYQVDHTKLNQELIRFDKCIDYIDKHDFNIDGFGLWEIPIFYAYCFYNKSTNQMFDLHIWELDSDVFPSYIDKNFNETKASSIKDAINNYCGIETIIIY